MAVYLSDDVHIVCLEDIRGVKRLDSVHLSERPYKIKILYAGTRLSTMDLDYVAEPARDDMFWRIESYLVNDTAIEGGEQDGDV